MPFDIDLCVATSSNSFAHVGHAWQYSDMDHVKIAIKTYDTDTLDCAFEHANAQGRDHLELYKNNHEDDGVVCIYYRNSAVYYKSTHTLRECTQTSAQHPTYYSFVRK